MKNRKLIDKTELAVSFLQIIGFVLLMLGVICLIVTPFLEGCHVPSFVSISFFITMLGFSFAFPTLLKGNKGLSTMRIVVFMMANVICMLLLKIGWADSIKALGDIGLNQYWVGVIAFLFGGKAAQSFFESRMATNTDNTESTGMAAASFSNAEIAKLAVEQNKQYLQVKFPNIISISDAVSNLQQADSHVVALYLKDNNVTGLPPSLNVRMPDGTAKSIATEIISSVGTGKIHLSQLDKVSNSGDTSFGSVCCVANSSGDSNFTGVITAGHVYTDGAALNKGGLLLGSDQKAAVAGSQQGNWYFQCIASGIDIGIIKLNAPNQDTTRYISLSGGYYAVSDADVQTTVVQLLSNVSPPRQGYILDYGIALTITYNDYSQIYMTDIILVGSTNTRPTSQPVSQKGDSGGCVYIGKKLVGLILGGDDKFTYVLAVDNTLTTVGLKPI